MSDLTRLCLGTAAFAIPGYRQSGQPMPTPAEAKAMLERAWDGGVRSYDTAQAYGDGLAERLLGETGIPSRKGARIITKLLPAVMQAREVPAAYARSVLRLGADPHAFLLHREKAQRKPRLRDALDHLPCPYVGVSVYAPREVDYAGRWATWLQYPANPVDRAIRPAGPAGHCVRQVRSVFLGGALLREGYPLGACLAYAFDGTSADLVTVGVGDMGQLEDVLAWVTMAAPRRVRGSVTGAQA